MTSVAQHVFTGKYYGYSHKAMKNTSQFKQSTSPKRQLIKRGRSPTLQSIIPFINAVFINKVCPFKRAYLPI